MNKTDIYIFDFLNFDGGAILNELFWQASHWPLFLVLGLVMIFQLYRVLPLKQFFVSLLFAGLVILIADQTANLFKSSIEFFRPSRMDGVREFTHIVNGYTGGLYGTVSGHAANSFGLALYGSLIIRKRWVTITLFSLALLTAYSRIYLGVHFPSQIIFGFITGMAVGSICYGLFTFVKNRMSRDRKRAI